MGRKASAGGYALQEDVSGVREHFQRWQHVMTAGVQRISDNRFWLAEEAVGIGLVGGVDRITHGLAGADLALKQGFNPVVVQINMPLEPGTVDGLAQVGRDPEGRLWLLRQGRLRPNGVSLMEIGDLQFSELTGCVPAFKTEASGDSPARLWYRVCRLDVEPALLRAQTVDFVRHCHSARERAAGNAPAEAPAGNFERARALQGKLEPTGQYEVPPQDRRIAERRHAEVVNALIAELSAHGVSNRKVWSIDGYEIDLAVGDPPASLLVEVKTSAVAQDVHTGTGQLMLYPKIMPELAQHQPVLLLPGSAIPALRNAIEACGIEVHTYARSMQENGQSKIVFDPHFRKRCGLS